MSLINIAWGLLIVLILAFGTNLIYNSGNKEKYNFYNVPIKFGMGIVLILMVVILFI